MSRIDLLWRGTVLVAALAAALLGLPGTVVGPLVGVGVTAVAVGLARLRGLGALDGLLAVVGGLLVALVLVGLVLGATPVGLHPTSWAVALCLVGAGGLGVLSRRPAASRVQVTSAAARALARRAPWAALSLTLVAVAVSMAVRGVAAAETPPLQMSLGAVTGTTVQVVVTSGTDTGPLEMRTTSAGMDVSYPLFTVAAGKSVSTTVRLPATGRYLVTLNYPNQSTPLRSLTLDR